MAIVVLEGQAANLKYKKMASKEAICLQLND